jgi:RNA polymerase sigma-70 factor (ECF subfamily)
MKESRKGWFGRSVENHMDALYGVALRLTRNAADAEDLVAESVAKAWTAIDTLAERERFRPWMFRILRNTFISHWRKLAVRPATCNIEAHGGGEDEDGIASVLDDQPEEFLAWWANPERAAFNALLGEQILSAVNSLPEAYRMVVMLINVDGLSYDETAQVLGVPAGTVRSRMKRGRTLLQKALWELARDSELKVCRPERPATSGKRI